MAVVPALEGANTMALKSTDPYTRSTGTVASKITTYDANGLATNGTQSGYTYSFGNGADTYDFTANTGKITADWQTVSIAWADFGKPTWGDTATLSQIALGKMQAIDWGVSNMATSFDFDLDDIELF